MARRARIELAVRKATVGPACATVMLADGEDPLEELVGEAVSAIAADVQVTVAGVTMPLAAWQDPQR